MGTRKKLSAPESFSAFLENPSPDISLEYIEGDGERLT
jgi:hypothetical protein